VHARARPSGFDSIRFDVCRFVNESTIIHYSRKEHCTVQRASKGMPKGANVPEASSKHILTNI